jgi:adenosine/AMP kinase
MELKLVPLEIPEGGNLILGQTHFIKSVEDIYEAIVNTVPQMKFGIAFNEASGPSLTRADGNDDALKSLAVKNATALAAGHVFVVVMRDGYPINVLGRIKDVPEGESGAGGRRGKRSGQGRSGSHRRISAQRGRNGRRRGEAPRISPHDRL